MVLADYNDENYDYTKYWEGRGYENESEFMALKKLLPKNYHKDGRALDIGGGFGRLLPIIKERFGDITIFDYSQKLLESAQENAKDLGIELKTIKGDVNLLSHAVNERYDCVTMIRVSHHLDDLGKVFEQVRDVMNENGIFIIETANKVHFKSVISNIIKGNLGYFDKKSVSVATKSVTFLNHHPKNVENILDNVGFRIERKLSVSNFRHPVFKKFIPKRVLLLMENFTQNLGALVNFGPSIFYKLTLK